MKRQILISLILLSSILTMNAQWNGTNPIYTNSNVGIGTTSPMTSLDIYGTTGIRISNGDPSSVNTYLYMGGSSNTFLGKSAIISVPNSAGWYRQDLCFALANGNDINSVSASDIAMTIKSYIGPGKFGYVGIGTTSPMTSLDVYGTTGIRISNGDPSSVNTYLYMGGSSNTFLGKSAIISVPNSAGWYRQDLCFALANGNDINSVSASDIAMTIKSYIGPGKFGYVGIGTSTPAYKLDVCGTIRANEVKVDLAGGCDFVFKNDYKLMDLKSLETFVKTKQHLPEIAPEKEMVENGVNMKELQMKLLQKIEELTLYTIEQNKKLEQQNDKIQKLEEKIEKIEAASK